MNARICDLDADHIKSVPEWSAGAAALADELTRAEPVTVIGFKSAEILDELEKHNFAAVLRDCKEADEAEARGKLKFKWTATVDGYVYSGQAREFTAAEALIAIGQELEPAERESSEGFRKIAVTLEFVE